MRSPSNILYVISDNSEVKIGISNDPNERLKTLQTSRSNTLYLRYVVEFYTEKDARNVENLLHTKYKSARLRGEWFSIDYNLIILDIEFALNFNVPKRLKEFKELHITRIDVPREPIFIYSVFIRVLVTIRYMIRETILIKNGLGIAGQEQRLKTSPKLEFVKEQLLTHPELRNMSSRELEKHFNYEVAHSTIHNAKHSLGVSHMTILKAKRDLKNATKT